MADQPAATLGPKVSLVRPSSPSDTGVGSERKRRRKVLSCYDCRRRKLQCDRVLPACGRCTKTGHASQCLYLDDPTDPPPTRPATGSVLDVPTGIQRPSAAEHSRLSTVERSSDLLARLEYQNDRIRQLETMLADRSHAADGNPVQRVKPTALSPEPQAVRGNGSIIGITDRETMLLRGKSFKTQFYGSTHPGALISHIPEMNLFTKEAFERFPGLRRMRQEMGALEDRTDYAGAKVGYVRDDDIRALLLPKDEMDEVLRLYFDTYGSLFHIVHIPSFWKTYNDMWQNGIDQTSAHFIALTLLMAATVSCLISKQPWLYLANSSLAREQAVTILQTCDDWLRRQSQKHVTALDFQVRCLLWLAKKTCARKFKRTWTEAGDLLRFCMSAGLHRNPDLIKKPTSTIDKELRRRVWATVVDFELQSSFDRGMISAPWLLQTDCSGPANIHDETMRDNIMPHPRAADEFTLTSYLSFAQESILLRNTLNAVLNNIRHSLTFEELTQFTEEIESHLRVVPQWTGDVAELSRSLLQLRLLQYLLAIHDRYIRSTTSRAERSFSQMTIIDTCVRTVRIHSTLIEKNNRALELLCQDHLRIALSVAHLTSIADPKADGILAESMNRQFPSIMDQIILMLTEKTLRYGREQRELWIALAANGFVKSKQDPDSRLRYMQEAVDKITRPYYKIMARQEDIPSAMSTADSYAGRDNGILDYLPPVPGDKATDITLGADQPILDLEELAAWTFEDWMFSPDDFVTMPGTIQQNPECYLESNVL